MSGTVTNWAFTMSPPIDGFNMVRISLKAAFVSALLTTFVTAGISAHADPDFVAGVAVNPQGEPLNDAEVFYIESNDGGHTTFGFEPNGERMFGGIIEQNLKTHKTGEDGLFRFEVGKPNGSLAVRHETGFTAITTGGLGHDMKVVVKPWGTLKGRALLDGNPMVGHPVGLSADIYQSRVAPTVFYYRTTYTDNKGRFTFKNFPAGSADLSLRTKERRRRDSISRRYIQVPPGSTLELDIGNDGIPLQGKIVPSDGVEINFEENFLFGNLIRTIPFPSNFPAPEVWENMSVEEREQWWPAFNLTDEGKARIAKFRDYGVPKISKDGTFRVDNVVPGEYRLSIVAYDNIDQDEMLGGAQMQMVVSEPSNDSEVVDVGILRLSPNRFVTLQKGDDAPPLTVETLDGDDIRLEDYRGKYVLLDFWATWCTPCLAQTDSLNEVYDKFGPDEKFEMIGLSLDLDKEAPARYAKKNDLRWIQGFVGPWDGDDTQVHEAFGIQGIPRLILVAPDGTIVESHMSGSSLSETISEYLR
jgi:thiol-disulfide isomerase/thioredoxin